MPEQWTQMMLFVLVAVLVIFAAYYTTYYLGKRTSKSAQGKNIRIRDRFAISRDKSFYLVQVKGKVYFLAVTNRTVTLLDTLESKEFPEQEERTLARVIPFSFGGVQRRLREWLDKAGSNLMTDFGFKVDTGPELYDLEERITMQQMKEEDNLDAVFREMQTGRMRRKATSSQGGHDEEG